MPTAFIVNFDKFWNSKSSLHTAGHILSYKLWPAVER